MCNGVGPRVVPDFRRVTSGKTLDRPIQESYYEKIGLRM